MRSTYQKMTTTVWIYPCFDVAVPGEARVVGAGRATHDFFGSHHPAIWGLVMSILWLAAGGS